MQPNRSQVHDFLLEFTGANSRVQSGSFKRDQLQLQFEGGSPARAVLRDLRSSCCMIDIDNSIFTLAYDDVMSVTDNGTAAVIGVRVGCLARDMNARLARSRHRVSRHFSYAQPASEPSRTPPQPEQPAADLETGFQTAQNAAARSEKIHENRASLEEIEAMLKGLWQETPRR